MEIVTTDSPPTSEDLREILLEISQCCEEAPLKSFVFWADPDCDGDLQAFIDETHIVTPQILKPLSDFLTLEILNLSEIARVKQRHVKSLGCFIADSFPHLKELGTHSNPLNPVKELLEMWEPCWESVRVMVENRLHRSICRSKDNEVQPARYWGSK
jgi:hypothetical protein